MSNYFVHNVLPGWWDGRIRLVSIKDDLDCMELLEPLPCGDGFVPVGYRYNGASSGIFGRLPVLHFPKWKHRIATARHDWRCEKATTAEERLFADKEFWVDVGIGGTKWEQVKGYTAVRIGSYYGSAMEKLKKFCTS